MSDSEIKALLQRIATMGSNQSKESKMLRTAIEGLTKIMSDMRDELTVMRFAREGK